MSEKPAWIRRTASVSSAAMRSRSSRSRWRSRSETSCSALRRSLSCTSTSRRAAVPASPAARSNSSRSLARIARWSSLAALSCSISVSSLDWASPTASRWRCASSAPANQTVTPPAPPAPPGSRSGAKRPQPPVAARPSSPAIAASSRREPRPASAVAIVAASTTTPAAKAICTAVSELTTLDRRSDKTKHEQRCRQRDAGRGHEAERGLGRAGQRLRPDRDRCPIPSLDRARDGDGSATDVADGRREHLLGADQQRSEQGCEDGLARDPVRHREVGGQNRKRAPARRQPEGVVEQAAEKLEVVRDGDEGAEGDERQQP